MLGTKLHVPAARPKLVERPRLTDRMATEPPRLVLLSAPAGFGKTTLLTQWLRMSSGMDHRVAWVSLDEGDNDPSRLLEHVVAALTSVCELPEATVAVRVFVLVCVSCARAAGAIASASAQVPTKVRSVLEVFMI